MIISRQAMVFILTGLLIIAPALASQSDDLISDGNVYYGQGMFREAIESFERAIELEPSNAAAWYNKGVSLFKVGQVDEAIASYEVAIGLDPRNSDYWYNKGNALYSKNLLNEAYAAYDVAIELTLMMSWPGWQGEYVYHVSSIMMTPSGHMMQPSR